MSESDGSHQATAEVVKLFVRTVSSLLDSNEAMLTALRPILDANVLPSEFREPLLSALDVAGRNLADGRVALVRLATLADGEINDV